MSASMDRPAGLCDECAYRRVIRSSRGSEFLMCRRAKDDPRYSKYPPLPVFACAGFVAGSPDDPSAGDG